MVEIGSEGGGFRSRSPASTYTLSVEMMRCTDRRVKGDLHTSIMARFVTGIGVSMAHALT